MLRSGTGTEPWSTPKLIYQKDKEEPEKEIEKHPIKESIMSTKPKKEILLKTQWPTLSNAAESWHKTRPDN